MRAIGHIIKQSDGSTTTRLGDYDMEQKIDMDIKKEADLFETWVKGMRFGKELSFEKSYPGGFYKDRFVSAMWTGWAGKAKLNANAGVTQPDLEKNSRGE